MLYAQNTLLHGALNYGSSHPRPHLVLPPSLQAPLLHRGEVLYLPALVEAQRHPPLRIVLLPVVGRLLPRIAAPQDRTALAAGRWLRELAAAHRGDALLLARQLPLARHHAAVALAAVAFLAGWRSDLGA